MTGAISANIPPQIEQAIKAASARTGTGFDYLLETAIRESGLKPQAKSTRSSATGLFQFVEQTWLKTVHTTGGRHGLGPQAAAISRDAQGRYDVADSKTRQEILALRNDPGVAAAMAGELTRANDQVLRASLGRAPSGGELYIGHFLGAGGASRLIHMARNDGQALAPEHFSAAAKANPAIFKNSDGTGRTVLQVYQNLVAKHATSAMTAAVIPRRSGPMSILPDRARQGSAQMSVLPARHVTQTRAPATNFLDLYGTGGDRPASKSAATRLVALRLYSEPASPPPAAPAPAPTQAPNWALWGGGLFTTLPAPGTR
ncbi:MAG: transglycosylase SLT domain-containing protein [Alphaproteobacteria bacterium]